MNLNTICLTRQIYICLNQNFFKLVKVFIKSEVVYIPLFFALNALFSHKVTFESAILLLQPSPYRENFNDTEITGKLIISDLKQIGHNFQTRLASSMTRSFPSITI